MPTPSPGPEPGVPPVGAIAGAEQPVDTGWLAAGAGVELRRMRASLGERAAPVSVVRLDPALVTFRVGYAPDAPLGLGDWANQAGALAAINGGFFDEQNRSVALLASGGQRFGESYSGQGGMFAVAPSGELSLRALADQPYDPAEPLAEALQGWPMLVKPGGEAAYSFEDGERARRSVVALDAAGRVLLIVCPTPAFTLRELSAWLAGSDLAIASALNLDGGSSSGLLLSADLAERIDPFVPLPIVLLAVPR